jgi:hypothetical protein
MKTKSSLKMAKSPSAKPGNSRNVSAKKEFKGNEQKSFESLPISNNYSTVKTKLTIQIIEQFSNRQDDKLEFCDVKYIDHEFYNVVRFFDTKQDNQL